jgi:hypothetical protein
LGAIWIVLTLAIFAQNLGDREYTWGRCIYR